VPNKILLVSRCAWTLYNFRAGLVRALKIRGETVIGGGAGGDGFEPKVEALGIPFVRLPVDKKGINPVADIRLFFSLYRWYRKERPDIVHHFTIKPVIYGSLAARFAGVPRIINTVTGLGYVFTGSRSILRRVVESMYRMALLSSHHTFFQNAEDQRHFIENRLVAKEKSGLLPGSGIDTGFFAPRPEPKSNTGSDLTFLMVSRLLGDKGIHEFVEAARSIRQDHPEAVFQILGQRDERNPTVVPEAVLEGWIREGIIEWLGEVEDVRPVIAAADVVVLPSYREGAPRALLEASAMEKPVITTDVPGCRQAVEDGVTGLLVAVKDTEALAEAMVRMIRDPQMRERMGKAGREKVVREFDERGVLEKIFKIYYIER
jgi:glycosyltransferase involved in cell wall biosynthesis